MHVCRKREAVIKGKLIKLIYVSNQPFVICSTWDLLIESGEHMMTGSRLRPTGASGGGGGSLRCHADFLLASGSLIERSTESRVDWFLARSAHCAHECVDAERPRGGSTAAFNLLSRLHLFNVAQQRLKLLLHCVTVPGKKKKTLPNGVTEFCGAPLSLNASYHFIFPMLGSLLVLDNMEWKSDDVLLKHTFSVFFFT